MKTEIINLMDCVDGTSTNSEGYKLYAILSTKLTEGKVKLSLKDSTPMSSSFLNSSFGELVEKFGMDSFINKLSLINYKPSQAEYIKDYLKNLRSYKTR